MNFGLLNDSLMDAVMFGGFHPRKVKAAAGPRMVLTPKAVPRVVVAPAVVLDRVAAILRMANAGVSAEATVAGLQALMRSTGHSP
jgi:hypothetical protein